VVDASAAQRQRVDAVERRRLVQRDEGVGVVPVATGQAVAVDDHDVGVALVEQRVRESQAHGPGTDDEIVRLQFVHARLPGSPPGAGSRAVHGAGAA